ncbi:DUF938 domain-containing protein [Erythrobacter sp. Alg231-14]|uniref:DUF938 domain-containing protein n=1 Tax=Erythrobacter sp. Alg231-14 TaxID=1922225 RepID=UPI000D55C0B3
MKKHAPATLRNREVIAQALAEELPQDGLVLEVASGSGEHAVFFADRFPMMTWQPSDPNGEAVASIRAYRTEFSGTNLRSPVVLDASMPDHWNAEAVDAIVCINMTHISPWAASVGLFKGAAQILSGKSLPLILYGPYFEHGVEPAPSNIAFDEGLRARNSEWGIRRLADMDALAHANGLTRTARREMPANNVFLVYRPG